MRLFAIFVLSLTAVSIAITTAGCGKKSDKGKFVHLNPSEDFEWMLGTWQRTYGTSYSYETWEKVDDGDLIGRGWALSDRDTAVSEHLTIINTDSGLFYVADVSYNPNPTYFRLVSYQGDTVTFENPEHDFPTRVIYHPIGEDSLFARIEGEKKGQATGVDFLFKRIN